MVFRMFEIELIELSEVVFKLFVNEGHNVVNFIGKWNMVP